MTKLIPQILGKNEGIVTFSLDKVRNQGDRDKCYICFCSGSTRALLLSVARYLWWGSRWYIDDPSLLGELTDLEIDEIEEYISQAEGSLIMACDAAELTSQIALLRGALTGETIDLDNLIVEGQVSYSTTGIQPKLEQIRALLEAANTNSDDVEEILDGIGVILGAAAILP